MSNIQKEKRNKCEFWFLEEKFFILFVHVVMDLIWHEKSLKLDLNEFIKSLWIIWALFKYRYSKLNQVLFVKYTLL